MTIVLIGYRGCGKTSVGRLLAARLGRPFVDTDTLIEQDAGTTIREIFATQGEAGFRDIESRIIQEVAQADGQIVSLGGGAVLRDANIDCFPAGRVFVWLTASARVLWTRISADTSTQATRPDLTTTGGLAEVQKLLAIREPIYRRVADIEINTEDVTTEQVVERILTALPAGSI